ncbi:hypothetical protein NEOKW01_2001 [Nematocida sp. AWRm80]|nr:hypothetical protein NEOKW01_2001 [Nematocida sp. AWRm80]
MDEYIADYSYTKSISCIGEGTAVGCKIDKMHLCVVAYNKITIWNTSTLSVTKEIECTLLDESITGVSVISKRDNALEDILIMIGYANGLVKILDVYGNEIGGYREYIKRVIGIICDSDIFVSYTTNAFTVYDTRTESIGCTVELELSITTVSIIGETVIVGTTNGIIHTYNKNNLLKGIKETITYSTGTQPVLGVSLVQDTLLVVTPDEIIRVPVYTDDNITRTMTRTRLGYRITNLSIETDINRTVRTTRERKELFNRETDSYREGINREVTESILNNVERNSSNEYEYTVSAICKDSKGKYHCISLDGTEIKEAYSFKGNRPLAFVQTLSKKECAVVFADNGISIYRNTDDVSSVEAGRENLIGVVANSEIVLGITPTEGRVFGKIVSKETVEHRSISFSLFEEEQIECVTVKDNCFYLGTREGKVRVRDTEGTLIKTYSLCNTPIISIHSSRDILVVATENKVLFSMGNETDEITYDDDVMCVRISDDGTLVVAALANNTVQVHKIDGINILSLYGHSVPVVEIEICLEAGLIYTLGGDKLIKVWGISHGECRKTIISPAPPTGILLHDNLLIVSTSNGILYFLKNTLKKIKAVNYPTTKKRAVPGQNRIAVTGYNLYTLRERSLAHYQENEYGTSPEEQAHLEAHQQETKEIEQEKKLFNVTATENFEKALDTQCTSSIYSALKQLTREDIHKAIEIMNTATKERLITAITELLSGSDYNPLLLGWCLQSLISTTPSHSSTLISLRNTLRPMLRYFSRVSLSNRTAIQWTTSDASDLSIA